MISSVFALCRTENRLTCIIREAKTTLRSLLLRAFLHNVDEFRDDYEAIIGDSQIGWCSSDLYGDAFQGRIIYVVVRSQLLMLTIIVGYRFIIYVKDTR